jgi:predicted aspartyl protease
MRATEVLLASIILAGTATALPAQTTPASPAETASALNKFLAQHNYGWVRTELSYNNAEFMKATINGREVRLMVDTGCAHTCLMPNVARSLNLPIKPMTGSVTGVGGRVFGTPGTTILSSFKVGPYEITRTNPIPLLSSQSSVPEGADGLFGLDYMLYNHVVLPVGSDLLFYRPVAQGAADISAYMVQLGFRPARIFIDRKVGLCVDGSVDGHALHAVVDCGAAYSTFDFDYVHGFAPGNLTTAPAKFSGADGRQLDTYVFSPHSVVLGGQNLPGDMYAVVRDLSFAQLGANALIGYDVMVRHNAIIDFGHMVMWLK